MSVEMGVNHKDVELIIRGCKEGADRALEKVEISKRFLGGHSGELTTKTLTIEVKDLHDLIESLSEDVNAMLEFSEHWLQETFKD